MNKLLMLRNYMARNKKTYAVIELKKKVFI